MFIEITFVRSGSTAAIPQVAPCVAQILFSYRSAAFSDKLIMLYIHFTVPLTPPLIVSNTTVMPSSRKVQVRVHDTKNTGKFDYRMRA